MFVAVLSFLGVGSRSLVQQESSINISDAGAARIRDLAFALLKVYLTLTAICLLGLWALGMPLFEAVCHAMCTIATGGFSPKNLSIGHYNDLGIELWIALFMFLSSIGFMLYIFALNKNWRRLKAEEEARYYLILLTVAIIAIALDLMFASTHFGYQRALHDGFFNVVSLASTTGFADSDYAEWPLFSKILLMVVMLIGGCAGSTAGGVKMNRVILFREDSPPRVDSVLPAESGFSDASQRCRARRPRLCDNILFHRDGIRHDRHRLHCSFFVRAAAEHDFHDRMCASHAL